jgi:ABC-2 type transport system permease protein
MTTTFTPSGGALALAVTEVRLVLRNRTVAVSSLALPLALGVFWAFTFDTDGDPAGYAMVIALQLGVVLGMAVYVTATQTLVARRHNGVLKRMRTSSLSDRGLLVATLAPSAALGFVQMLIFAAFNVATGAPLPVDPVPLVLAVLGGLALAVTAALATAVLTPSPERAQITTLPLTFLLLGGAVATAVIPLTVQPLQLLALVPGAGIGQLVQLATTGGTWSAGLGGIPVVVLPVVGLAVWSVVLGWYAARRFRWDARR